MIACRLSVRSSRLAGRGEGIAELACSVGCRLASLARKKDFPLVAILFRKSRRLLDLDRLTVE